MDNDLKLTVDSTGQVVKAEINDNDVGKVFAVSQSFLRGSLRGQLTLGFDIVTVEEAPPAELVPIVASFVKEQGSQILITITSPQLTLGNTFAYKFVEAISGPPVEPSPWDIIDDATTMSNNTVVVYEGAYEDYYVLYELDSQNRVVSYLAHTLSEDEGLGS